MSMLGNLTIAKSTSYISTIPNKSCSQLLYLRVDAYSESLKWSTGLSSIFYPKFHISSNICIKLTV